MIGPLTYGNCRYTDLLRNPHTSSFLFDMDQFSLFKSLPSMFNVLIL